ncbi:MAG: hypothetical protein ABEJ98_02215 [Candidatus Nanohaloarchaea archaeon]
MDKTARPEDRSLSQRQLYSFSVLIEELPLSYLAEPRNPIGLGHPVSSSKSSITDTEVKI